jgi:hypothetical protein
MDQFPTGWANTGNIRAGHSLYPRQCTLVDLARAYMETDNNKNGTKNIPKLRAWGLNYEIHSAGWLEEWPPYTCDTNMLPSCGAGPDYTWWQAISPPQPKPERQPIRPDVLLVRRRSRYAAAGVIGQNPRQYE